MEQLEANAARAAAEKKQQDAKLAALHTLQKLLNRPDALAVFKRFDTDNSHTVDRNEMLLGLKSIGEHLEDSELDALMRADGCPSVASATGKMTAPGAAIDHALRLAQSA